MKALFDTNILIDYLTGRDEARAEIERHTQRLASVVTWMELLAGAAHDDEEDVIEPAQLHPWKLNLQLAGSDLTVTGLGINSRWTTNLQIGGLADQPRFTGRADLVQGNYDFAGRNFRLDRGIIRFRGESPPDPQLDIHAQADVQGLSATVNVQGTGLRPEITFASTPPMPHTTVSHNGTLSRSPGATALPSSPITVPPMRAHRSAEIMRAILLATSPKTQVSCGNRPVRACRDRSRRRRAWRPGR